MRFRQRRCTSRFLPVFAEPSREGAPRDSPAEKFVEPRNVVISAVVKFATPRAHTHPPFPSSNPLERFCRQRRARTPGGEHTLHGQSLKGVGRVLPANVQLTPLAHPPASSNLPRQKNNIPVADRGILRRQHPETTGGGHLSHGGRIEPADCRGIIVAGVCVWRMLRYP